MEEAEQGAELEDSGGLGDFPVTTAYIFSIMLHLDFHALK